MLRPLLWSDRPTRARPRVDLTCEQLRAIRRGNAIDTQDLGHGDIYLYEDRHDWPRAWCVYLVTVIVGPWKWGGRGPGDRVACEDDDPDRYFPERPGPDRALGYLQVWTECPALDKLESAIAARRPQ